MSKKILCVGFCIITMLLNSIVCLAAQNPILQVGSVASFGAESIKVPIALTGNTGICGAKITVTYDKNLKLTNVEKGDAFTTMVMTTPGNMEANPVNLFWDGLVNDTSNGTIAVLTFDVPKTKGKYDISLSYTYGDVVNEKLEPVGLQLVQGSIEVMSEITAEIGNKRAVITPYDANKTDGYVYVAFYNSNGQMTSIKAYNPTSVISVKDDSLAAYAKVMWFNNALHPLCDAKRLPLR